MFCAMWTLTAVAQKTTERTGVTIESIRKQYQDIHEWISQMSKDFPAEGVPPEYYELEVLQNLAGTGPHMENIRMYFGDEESEEEEYNPYPPHYLLFTTAKYNFAAREYYEEYLYDNKGNIMFIYAITPDVDDDLRPYELRMWFDGKRLLRFMAKKFEGPIEYIDIATLKKGTFKEEYTGKTIPEKYESETDRCKQRAQRFLIMFKSIDDNTYI